MEFTKGNNRFYKEENDKLVAEITWIPKEDTVEVDHTFVDPSLRGQGVAEKLVDKLVDEMQKEQKKIKPICPYVVKLFERKPDKYEHVQAFD